MSQSERDGQWTNSKNHPKVQWVSAVEKGWGTVSL